MPVVLDFPETWIQPMLLLTPRPTESTGAQDCGCKRSLVPTLKKPQSFSNGWIRSGQSSKDEMTALLIKPTGEYLCWVLVWIGSVNLGSSFCWDTSQSAWFLAVALVPIGHSQCPVASQQAHPAMVALTLPLDPLSKCPVQDRMVSTRNTFLCFTGLV